MKYKFFNENNKKLIIFFNGWGMDEIIISHLDRENFDLLVFYDYRDLELDTSVFDLEKYFEKHIIAWSMGVMVSTLFDFENINSRTAINGTIKAIDDNYGIPLKIYDLTIKGFSEFSIRKFMKRMFDEKPPIDNSSNRDLDSQKEELIKLMEVNQEVNQGINDVASKERKFDRVLVSDTDNIIPTKNQLNYWHNPEIIKGGHCPFFKYKSWKELL